MDFKAILEYKEQNEITHVIDWLNARYKLGSRSFEVRHLPNNKSEITVSDQSDLIPYGIFEVGSNIGQKWMKEHYQIQLGSWEKVINRELFNDEYYPQYENVDLTLMNNESLKFKVKTALGINSSINTIKPYLNTKDYDQIAKTCEFKTINNINSKVHLSKNGLRINYHIVNSQLLIFGTKQDYTDKQYKVNLIAAFEVNIPNYGF